MVVERLPGAVPVGAVAVVTVTGGGGTAASGKFGGGLKFGDVAKGNTCGSTGNSGAPMPLVSVGDIIYTLVPCVARLLVL